MAVTIVKISRIGGSHGIVLPDEILDAAGVRPGEEIAVTVMESGIIQLAPQGSRVSEQVDKAREIARRYKTALRELAK